MRTLTKNVKKYIKCNVLINESTNQLKIHRKNTENLLQVRLLQYPALAYSSQTKTQYELIPTLCRIST